MRNLINSLFLKKNKNYFYRLIGIENSETYNNDLKTIYEKFKDNYLIFDGEIKLKAEIELIEYVYKELETIDIHSLKDYEIILFEDKNINNIFINSLQQVVNLSIINENFFNENTRNNFITKIIVWAFTYLKDIDFHNDINPKVVYYGQIERHEIYFLFLLYYMNFDVLYINPLKEEFFEEIDINKITILKNYMKIGSIDSFFTRCEKGEVMDVVETLTKKIQTEVHEELFNNTGLFKPWQFRNGFTKSILLDTILDDIYIYYKEPARLRDGFEVNKKCVSVPCFFFKIDGEYFDKNQYQKLVKYTIKSSPKTVFFNSPNISLEASFGNEIYKIMFYELSDGTFDIEDIKRLSIYTLNRYSEETQNFLLNKFNEIIIKRDIYVNNLQKEEKLKLLSLILNMNDEILKLVDSFDFVDKIPKIVIYLNNEEVLSNSTKLLLGYLANIGFDIIIFNPSSLCNISDTIKNTRFINFRLEDINYKSNYNMLGLMSTQNKIKNFFNGFK